MALKMKFDYGVAGVSVQVVRKDGDNEEQVGTHEFGLDSIPAELQDGEAVRSLAAYGLGKMLQDRTSGIPAENKLEEMQAVYDMLAGGVWKVRKESTAKPKGATIDMVFASAVAAFMTEKAGKEVSVAAATLMLQKKSQEERKALKAHEGIAELMKAKRAEAEAELEGLDDLLGG